MLRILSWSSGLGCDKIHDTDLNMFVSKQQPSPISDFSLSTAVKRKRSPSYDDHTNNPLNTEANLIVNQTDPERTQSGALAPSETVIKTEPSPSTDLSHPNSLSAMADSQPADVVTQKSSETKVEQMRQTISTQLSLEILLKHKELRLIDQEIAKCQIALEQLRRCSEIPYPGIQTPSVLVSEGKGAALRRSGEQFPARSPAPWGVTDGPYTRHYAKWLLPDARFDGGESEVVQVQNIMDAAVPARSTRGSFADAGKTIKPRSTIRSGSFHALPANYGQPKEKATGPMVLKRKSDNAMVKLVCPDCGRHDFGSAQGFINHCRIGHSRSFASHDAAAEACGEPIEYNDNGTIKGVEPVTTPVNTNMHPLIRSAKLLPPVSSNLVTSSAVRNPKARRTKKMRSSATSPDFSPSMQTPHLSALIQSQGLGLNLQRLVTDVKSKVELPESDHEEDEMDIDSPVPVNPGRHPQVAGSKQPMKSASSKHRSSVPQGRVYIDRDVSSAESRAVEHQPRLAIIADGSQSDFMHSLIPSPTNDSVQAPSLVDDDEEFEPQSPPSSDEVDDAEVEFDIQDDEHGERTVLRGSDLTSTQATCVPTSPARAHARRPSAIRRSFVARTENKNVSFAKTGDDLEGGDKKRRRVEEN